MKQRKKNKFLTFICSLLPGAAEMYMGFMKMGFSLMVIFFMILFLGAVFGGEAILYIAAIITWFYAFFHARNVATLDNETFANMPDRYVWEEFESFGGVPLKEMAFGKFLAGILILAGALLLLKYAEDIVYILLPKVVWGSYYTIIHKMFDKVPRVIASFVLIVIGINMIRGRKKSE